MKLKKTIFTAMVIFMGCLLLVNPGFSQTAKGKAVSYFGTIESVSIGSKLIGINEAPVRISPNTKIIGEKGNAITLGDLTSGLYVRVEGIQKSDGVHASKITVQPRNTKRR